MGLPGRGKKSHLGYHVLVVVLIISRNPLRPLLETARMEVCCAGCLGLLLQPIEAGLSGTSKRLPHRNLFLCLLETLKHCRLPFSVFGQRRSVALPVFPGGAQMKAAIL